MTFDPDDPRLSALALGELEPAEAVEMEAMLAASPEARSAVEEIRAAARVLTASLAREPAPPLDATRKRAIEARLKSRRRARLIAGLGTLAAAACAVLAVRMTLAPTPGREPSRQLRALADGKAAPVVARTAEAAPVVATAPAGPDAFFGQRGEVNQASAPSEMAANSQRDAAAPAPSGPSAPIQFGFGGRMNSDPRTLGLERDKALAARSGRARNRTSGLADADVQRRSDEVALAAGVTPGKPGESMPSATKRKATLGAPTPPLPAVVSRGAVTSADLGYGLSADAKAPMPAAKPDLAGAAGDRPETLGRKGEATQALALLEKEALAKRKDVEPRREQEVDGAKRDRVPIADPAAPAPEPAPAPAPIPPTVENPFVAAAADPLSTFAVDVDTASYTQVRKSLMVNLRPDPEAVRVEEMINYFSYKYPQPTGDEPFSVTADVARCPWDASHRLARIGLRGKDIDLARRPASNLVFLLDVSGSMNEPNKLPLVKQAMGMLVERLGENDRVSMVVYAGASGVALPPTHGDRKAEILSALEELQAGGSTNGGAGIRLAYDLAAAQFIKGGINRVILCTDGDFNVGTTGVGELETLIEQRRKTGVFLSVLGFGLGDGKNNAGAREVDRRMEGLADKGNGNYASIDDAAEARKVLVEQMGATLVTIAKDVKIQVEFNPAKVASARLIGYENRRMAHADFRDDAKDAGEIGAGHTVTALYEIVPAAKGEPGAAGLKYKAAKGDPSEESFSVRVRYKAPDGDVAKEQERGVIDANKDYAEADDDYKFAAAVAAFGMILRDSPHKGQATYDTILEWAGSTKEVSEAGSRREFLELVRKAKSAGR